MKKKLLILTFLGLLSSCRNDNEQDNSESKIIGKWNFNKTVVKSGKNSSIILSTENFDSCHKKSTLEFTSNKMIEILYDLVSNTCILTSNESTNYSIDSNNNIVFDGESSKIISVTSKELVLLDDDSYDFNHDGTNDQFLLYLDK